MTDILSKYAQSLGQLAQARRQHRDFLEGTQDAVRPLWNAFEEAFGKLAESAEKRGIEWNAPDPRSEGIDRGWRPNGHLVGIKMSDECPDSVVFTTHQAFRNEIDESEATIPLRFLGEDGLAVMQAEAAQLGAELDRLIAERTQQAARMQEEHERAEFERLNGIYGKPSAAA
jgi:hypothetical protein